MTWILHDHNGMPMRTLILSSVPADLKGSELRSVGMYMYTVLLSENLSAGPEIVSESLQSTVVLRFLRPQRLDAHRMQQTYLRTSHTLSNPTLPIATRF